MAHCPVVETPPCHPVTGAIGGALRALWEEEGWCLVPGLLPARGHHGRPGRDVGAVPHR